MDFIKASQAGMDRGAFIMHRCHGSTTDINLDATRAVTKMKATITQRFNLDGCEVDAESDCRFCFFWIKTEQDEWKARYVRHWYEKVGHYSPYCAFKIKELIFSQDKLIPCNPLKIPHIDEAMLKQYPSGYRYLAYCQEKTMAVKVLLDLPGHRRENGIEGGNKICGEKHDMLYWQCKDWVEGRGVEI